MAGAGQGGGEMDLLAGYIANPIDENGGVRFTVIDGVRVTTSLEGRDEVPRGRDLMTVLDDKTMDRIALPRGVRFTGRPDETVTILLEQIPQAQQPGFREPGDDAAVKLKVSIPIEGSSSKTDEQPDSEKLSRKVGPPVPFEKLKEPVEEELRKEFEQQLVLLPRGEKEEQLELWRLLNIYLQNVGGKEELFLDGDIKLMGVDKVPGIGDTYSKKLKDAGITTVQDLYNLYNKIDEEEFKNKLRELVVVEDDDHEMQTQYVKDVVQAITMKRMKELVDSI